MILVEQPGNLKQSTEFLTRKIESLSEVDLGKALELAYLFLPEQMPWVILIFKIYERTKQESNMIIVVSRLFSQKKEKSKINTDI